jgi:hypothetical protein
MISTLETKRFNAVIMIFPPGDLTRVNYDLFPPVFVPDAVGQVSLCGDTLIHPSICGRRHGR